MQTQDIIGYQVWDDNGNHAAGRTSLEILDLQTAQRDFRLESRKGAGKFRVNPVYTGEIENPLFISEASGA